MNIFSEKAKAVATGWLILAFLALLGFIFLNDGWAGIKLLGEAIGVMAAIVGTIVAVVVVIS